MAPTIKKKKNALGGKSRGGSVSSLTAGVGKRRGRERDRRRE